MFGLFRLVNLIALPIVGAVGWAWGSHLLQAPIWAGMPLPVTVVGASTQGLFTLPAGEYRLVAKVNPERVEKLMRDERCALQYRLERDGLPSEEGAVTLNQQALTVSGGSLPAHRLHLGGTGWWFSPSAPTRLSVRVNQPCSTDLDLVIGLQSWREEPRS